MVHDAETDDPPPQLAAEKDVGRTRKIVGECEILVDDFDPGVARILRPTKAHLTPVETHGPVGRRKIPGDNLDQGRLAGAVVADQADDLARRHRVIDLGERANGAVFHVDAAQLEKRHDESLTSPTGAKGHTTASRRFG